MTKQDEFRLTMSDGSVYTLHAASSQEAIRAVYDTQAVAEIDTLSVVSVERLTNKGYHC